MDEKFKLIPGIPGYCVDIEGRVYSLSKWGSGNIGEMSYYVKTGYPSVCL